MFTIKRNPVTPKFLRLDSVGPTIKDPLSLTPPVKLKRSGAKPNRREFIRQLIKAGVIDVNAIALQLRRNDYEIPSAHALTDYISRSKQRIGIVRNPKFKGLREERRLKRNLL